MNDLKWIDGAAQWLLSHLGRFFFCCLCRFSALVSPPDDPGVTWRRTRPVMGSSRSSRPFPLFAFFFFFFRPAQNRFMRRDESFPTSAGRSRGIEPGSAMRPFAKDMCVLISLAGACLRPPQTHWLAGSVERGSLDASLSVC